MRERWHHCLRSRWPRTPPTPEAVSGSCRTSLHRFWWRSELFPRPWDRFDSQSSSSPRKSADVVDCCLGALQRLGRGLVIAAQRSAEHLDDAAYLVGNVVPALLLGGVLFRGAVGLIVRHGELHVAITLIDQGLQVTGDGIEMILGSLGGRDVEVSAVGSVSSGHDLSSLSGIRTGRTRSWHRPGR